MPVAITTEGLEGEGVHSSQASATDRGGPGARAIDGTINGVLAEDAPSQPSVTEPTGSMGGETCESALRQPSESLRPATDCVPSGPRHSGLDDAWRVHDSRRGSREERGVA